MRRKPTKLHIRDMQKHNGLQHISNHIHKPLRLLLTNLPDAKAKADNIHVCVRPGFVSSLISLHQEALDWDADSGLVRCDVDKVSWL